MPLSTIIRCAWWEVEQLRGALCFVYPFRLPKTLHGPQAHALAGWMLHLLTRGLWSPAAGHPGNSWEPSRKPRRQAQQMDLGIMELSARDSTRRKKKNPPPKSLHSSVNPIVFSCCWISVIPSRASWAFRNNAHYLNVIFQGHVNLSLKMQKEKEIGDWLSVREQMLVTSLFLLSATGASSAWELHWNSLGSL